MYLSPHELALFAELLDPLSNNEEMRLLRDRIETYLYVSGYYDEQVDNEPAGSEWIEGSPWRAGEWHVWDGLHDAYGPTIEAAVAELRRYQGKA
jgi:hypothetical protein